MFRIPFDTFKLVRPRYFLHKPHIRAFHGPSNVIRGLLSRRTTARVTVITAGTAVLLSTSTVYAHSAADDDLSIRPTIPALVRAYVVYSMCSIPSLVDSAPKILSTLSAIPGVRQITEAVVRVTFFNQFVGADTAEEAIPLLHSLRNANKGALFAYSVEVDENEATGGSTSSSTRETHGSPYPITPNSLPASAPLSHKHLVNEILHCIDVAADFEDGLSPSPVNGAQTRIGRRTWVAVKITPLLPDAHALIALSSYITETRKLLPASSPERAVAFPGSARIEDLDAVLRPSRGNGIETMLTPTHIQYIRDLHADLVRICAKARDRGVKIIVDAEYSWYQPAIDALTLALMREFNSLEHQSEGKIQPLVYATFQAYLRRTPAHLALALEDARKNKYALGVKLVRGAYLPHEIAAHTARRDTAKPRPSLSISPDVEPPVWTEKKDSDATYNACVRMLIDAVKADVDRCAQPDIITPKLYASITTPSKGWFGWISGLIRWKKGTTEVVPSSKPMTEVHSLPGLGVLFGTHNWDSCALILKELVRTGLAVEDTRTLDNVEDKQMIKVGPETAERVTIGQLYGMSDDLTEWVASRITSSTPFVIKYLPYGALAQVMPYLSRRAIENKSVLNEGAAIHERQRAGLEIRKRIFG